jgi:hypothetical protein
MTAVAEALLEGRMTETERARSWSPRVISRFEALIRDGDDRSLDRVSPLAFARDRAVAEAESIDLFLHAARCGWFEMHWDVLCPQSGMVLDSFGALRTLRPTEYDPLQTFKRSGCPAAASGLEAIEQGMAGMVFQKVRTGFFGGLERSNPVARIE